MLFNNYSLSDRSKVTLCSVQRLAQITNNEMNILDSQVTKGWVDVTMSVNKHITCLNFHYCFLKFAV